MKDNLLINETSLYLLQHAQNPVNWEPWSENAFKNAKEKNKIVLVSIGYSSCHWCHVMEHESFQDQEIADFMNKNFICIKVDREERPDIDHLYMKAIQLMGINGGWPLNCFVLPDGKPIYGGTYFKKKEWLRILKALVETYHNDEEKVITFAQKLLTELRNQNQQLLSVDHSGYSEEVLNSVLKTWEVSFDYKDGGFDYVPKFPMPNSLISIYSYALHKNNNAVIEFVNKTLCKLSYGGLFDHVEGGFARYSTDAIWKVPHFEKMLYDNAQLIHLYSFVYSQTPDKCEYKSAVNKSIKWLQEALKTSYGSYLCSQDADSEGVEGAFYCWTENELKTILKEDFEWFSTYFNISEDNIWEEDRYILYKDRGVVDFALAKSWSIDEFQSKLNDSMDLLKEKRKKRKKPAIDTKSLTSWNALLIKAFVHAYIAFEEELYLEEAKEISNWIIQHQTTSDYCLHHNFVNGESSIDGFLEDYAFTIDAFILLYQATGELIYLNYAKNFLEKVELDFSSKKQELFYFSNVKSTLISRKIDVEDDVMPSSNSVLAHSFFSLGVYFRRPDWTLKSKQMLSCVIDQMERFPMSYSNWFHLYSRFLYSTSEISIIDNDEVLKSDDLNELINPFVLISHHSSIPMSKEFNKGIYVCKNQTCLPQMKSVKDLIQNLKG